ncbi:Uncharacterised protein [Klebsiella pneumoniae]|uniref:Uncharacterized protein n=1 Tax=Klebsiella pneumoniae TaxID=573 RepID=A0A377TSE8_KLEPN|nr:Uncharacterised protein [Klebsiella pneumoniae]
MLGAFQPQGILRWHQAGFQRVVTVNHRQVDIVEGARDLWRFNLQNLQVFRVLDNILRRRQGGGRVGKFRVQLNKLLRLQQEQRPAQVVVLFGTATVAFFRQ